METKPNDLVNQVIKKHYIGDGNYEESVNGGLSKREYFAAMAMQGMMANSDAINRVWKASKELNGNADAATDACLMHVSLIAVEQADALIRQLNAKETPENQSDLQGEKS